MTAPNHHPWFGSPFSLPLDLKGLQTGAASLCPFPDSSQASAARITNNPLFSVCALAEARSRPPFIHFIDEVISLFKC